MMDSIEWRDGYMEELMYFYGNKGGRAKKNSYNSNVRLADYTDKMADFYKKNTTTVRCWCSEADFNAVLDRAKQKRRR